MVIKVKDLEELYCHLSGKPITKEEAMFITSSPGNTLIVDLSKELPGKHLCLECKRKVIELAIKQDILKKFFGEDLNIPTDFAEKIFVLLRKKATDLLCLAKKSGSLTFGFEKVMAALKAGESDFILHASDGKEGGKQKTGLNAGAVRIFSVFTSLELGKIIGRNRVVHIAILKGNANMIKSLVVAITRVQNF